MAEVSRFWQELAGEHSRLLRRHGFDSIKREQAHRYFNWRWRWTHVHRSEQARFLLAHTSLREFIAALWPQPDEDWSDVDWSRAEQWLYKVSTRLLWQYAQPHRALQLPEPGLGNPLPVHFNGRLISQDLANTALELSFIGAHVRPTSVLEIGAGYGRTAYAFLSLNPRSTYTIIDIEPALSISKWYLTELFDSSRLTFLTPDQAGEASRSDLAISISTLAEMTPDAVDEYLGIMDRCRFVYLKQWESWRNPIDGYEIRFSDYPIPSGWTNLDTERCPVQTSFRQAIWRTS